MGGSTPSCPRVTPTGSARSFCRTERRVITISKCFRLTSSAARRRSIPWCTSATATPTVSPRAEDRAMDDCAYAGPQRLLLLPARFHRRQQDADAPLGAGDHDERLGEPRSGRLSGARNRVEGQILIIVENSPVPHDTRVWKEATTLQRKGYEVTVLSPREKKGCRKVSRFSQAFTSTGTRDPRSVKAGSDISSIRHGVSVRVHLCLVDFLAPRL